MSTLRLTVGGRSFALAVQPGEEDHIVSLGKQIDAKFQQLAPRYSQNLLFAALQLADDLHRSQLSCTQAREEAQAIIEDNATLKRKADIAVGQTDGLKTRIGELEQELERLQSSIQQESNKYNDLIADIERYKIAVMEADAEQTRILGELASVRQERDAFERQLAEAPAPVQSGFLDLTEPATDPDLAPSLERFAEMLEICVAKLEGTAPAP